MVVQKEQLVDWARQLKRLDNTNCVYVHHAGDTDFGFAPLCSDAIQNNRHGCAHATNYILGTVIQEMTGSGELLPDEGIEMLHTITADTHGKLAVDDHSIALEPVDDARYGIIQKNQKTVIDRRQRMANVVLRIIDDRMEDFEPDASGRIGLPLV